MSETQITKQSNELTVFEPTPHMEKWLDKAMELGTDNISEIEKQSKITAQSWYTWLKKPGFIEWFEAEWDRRLKGHGWKLDVIGMKNSKRDYRYWEGMQKRLGRLNEGGTKVQVNVLNQLQKEADEFNIR